MSYKSFISFLCLFVSATFLYATDLQVVTVTPKGENAPGGRSPVSVTFNQPVAALGESSAFSSENCPLIISPEVKGTCRFVGTQTLQFEPEGNWPPATQYTALLPGTFTSKVSEEKLGKDYQWTFTTKRPQIEQVIPSNGEQWIDVRPLIYVTLSQPVDLVSAQEATQVSYRVLEKETPTWWEQFKSALLRKPVKHSKGVVSVPVKVRGVTDTEYREHYSYLDKKQIFVVELEQDLAPHAEVTLQISSALRSVGGMIGPETDFKSVFYTYPKLEIVGGKFEGCLPFDAKVAFTSPVRLGDLLAHISIEPKEAMEKVSDSEKETLGYQNYVSKSQNKEKKELISLPVGNGYFAMPFSFLHLNPEQTITVKIDKDLTDIYGQKLGTTQYVTLHNNGYCPSVVFEGGTGVLESYLPARHPIDVMNVSEVEVKAARFNRTNFIPFTENQRDSYCSEEEIAGKQMQYDGNYSFDIIPNKSKKTYLDLQKFNPTARESIIYSQVRVPSKYRQSGFCWEAATDNITDLGVLFKTSRENILVWVTSLKDATPKADATVELRDQDNRILWTGKTDSQGVALAPGMKELNVTSKHRWSRPIVYAFVGSENGDAVIASNWDDGIEPWRFNLNFNYGYEPNHLITALFTDRGIYRPGETVYVKGLTRRQQDGQWQLPSLKKGTLKVINSREEEVLKKEVSYTANGAFDISFEIPQEAATGSWSLQFSTENDETEADYSFRVEAVKQADFAVHLRSLKDSYLSAEKAEFSGSAEYLFGAPVTGGKAKWTLRRSSSWFSPQGYEDYEFMPYFLTEDEKYGESLLAESSGELNAQGQINFEVLLPKVSHREMIYAELGVQAPTGEQLFSRTQVALNPASLYIGAFMDKWAAEQGQTASARIVALTPEGKPTGPVKVSAQIEKVEYFSVRKKGLAGRLEWVNDRRIKKVDTKTFTVSEEGTNFDFSLQEPGSYRVTLSAKDKQGQEVRGGFTMYIYGKGESYWSQNDDDILILKQDKEEYLPGETARILVQSPYEEATALVTVERNGILKHWTTQIHSGADYVDIPVEADYTPNVFVNVTVVRGRAAEPAYDKEGLDLAKPQGKTGYAVLKVSRREREIETQVSTAQKQYLPKEEVTVNLTTALQGKPISADVTVMVVDEGILALTGYKMPNLLDVFYAPFRLSVSTADNRVFLIGQRNFGEKGENRGGGGGLFNQLGGTDLRSHFEFTPYFNARVQTDEQGQAQVKFTLPDNLTTFRIMAVSAAVQEFGGAQTSVKVSKPLMVLPKLPRFARRADQFQCGAVVYNYETEEQQITVAAQADGAVSLINAKPQQIKVASGASAEVTWNCHAISIGESELTFAAQAGQAKDAVRITLPVKEVEKEQQLAVYAETQETAMQLLERPTDINQASTNTVTLSLTSSALLNLRGSMLYLLTYPYDCLEQQMSKILPVVEGADLMKAFQLADPQEYQKTVQSILNKMPTYQTETGAMAYWPEILPDPYVTAYALEVAHLAKQAGYEVPTAALEKAVTWLKGVFGGEQVQAYLYSPIETQTMRAYAVYVLSLYNEKMESQFNTLYTQRNALSIAAQSYLLLAAERLNKSVEIQQALAQEIINHAQYTPQTIHFATDKELGWLHISSVKTTALALEALLKSSVQFPQAYQVVRWLLQQLNTRGHWQNTSDNAAVFKALHTFYKLNEKDTPNFRTNVSLNGEILFSPQFVGRSVEAQQTAWPFDQVYAQGDQSRVELAKFGTGTLYYSIMQTYTPSNYANEINAGMTVSREITDLKGNVVTEFKTGERYKVTLHINTPSDYTFVVLEDHIPAGFVIANTDLTTESQADAAQLQQSTWRGFQRNEKYDDHIVAFADSLPSGEHEYSYLVQTTTAGTFSYPSMWGSQMYEPAVFGRNATSSLVVLP